MWMRKAGNVLTLVSLLLLVGVVVLWVGGERQENAVVIESRFIFGNRSQVQWSSFDGKIIVCEPEVIDYGDTTPPVFRVSYYSETFLHVVSDSLDVKSYLGFGVYSGGSIPPGVPPFVIVPDYALCILFAILPGRWIYRRWRAQRIASGRGFEVETPTNVSP